MSEICVSVAEVDRYLENVQSASEDIRSKYNETVGHVNTTIQVANNAIKKASEALQQMVNDYNEAQKTLAHDEALLNVLVQKLEQARKAKYAAERAVSAAGDAYRAACREQTAAKNSSASTEEEAKARAARIRAANAAVKETRSAYYQAQEEYKRLCNLVRELEWKVNQCRSFISQLQNLIYSIHGKINEAESFINQTRSDAERLSSAASSFSKTAEECSRRIGRCYSIAGDARNSLYSAVSALCAAGGTSVGYNESVRMHNGAESLRPMIRQMGEARDRLARELDEQKRKARIYGEDMQDDISEAAVYVALEVCDHLQRANELMEEIRQELIKAQKYLEGYSSHSSASV